MQEAFSTLSMSSAFVEIQIWIQPSTTLPIRDKWASMRIFFLLHQTLSLHQLTNLFLIKLFIEAQ